MGNYLCRVLQCCGSDELLCCQKNQVCFDIIGGDVTITLAAEAGQLQLNVFEPIIAFRLLRGLESMRNACTVLRERCVVGITANKDRLRWYVENSIGVVTALVPVLGYEVATAFNGAEALELAAREKPRAAIIDIGMPGMSGHEVARRMRREAWGKHAVLIALTGWGQEQDKLAARSAGFDDHLTKPVDPEEIARVLARHLGQDPPRQINSPTLVR